MDVKALPPEGGAFISIVRSVGYSLLSLTTEAARFYATEVHVREGTSRKNFRSVPDSCLVGILKSWAKARAMS